MDAGAVVFSSREALELGWQRTLANLKPLLVLGLLGGFLAILHQGLSGARGAFLASIVVQLAQVALGLVFLRVLLEINDGHAVDLNRPAELWRGFVPYLLSTLLVGLIVAGGFVLLIVPGVLWALRFGLAPMIVADEGRDPMDALRESARLTEGVRADLFAFAALALGVNLLGALALGVGLLLTVPTTGLAAVHVFRRLQARAAAFPTTHVSPGRGVPPPVLT